MNRFRTLVVIVFVSAAVPASTVLAAFNLQISPACDGAGVGGSAQNLNNTISFQACGTEDGYHALIRDAAGRILLEVFHDTLTEETTYLIDGIEVGENHTPEELARMEGVMMSKEVVGVASSLYARMNQIGFAQTSDAMIALGGLIAGIVDTGPYVVVAGLNCDDCLDPSTNCRGCCGPGCWGCSGYCTEECYEHDKCTRDETKPFGACTGKFIQAIWSWFRAMRNVDDCGVGPGTSPGGPGDGSGGSGCQDPSGCCPDDYHECCNNKCCSNWTPPSTCPP